MRLIEFRGKRIDNGEWVYGSLLQSEIDINELNVKCQIHERFAHDFSIRNYDVIPESVGQLVIPKSHEHNNIGNNIFEGDVVSSYGIKYLVSFLIFDDEQGYFIDMDNTDLEILGNIFDNPELFPL